MKILLYEEYKAVGSDGENYKLTYFKSCHVSPIQFIHGILTYSFIREKKVTFIDKDNRVITVDILGFGPSDLIINISFNMVYHTRIIFLFMEPNGCYEFHLVGYDVVRENV